MNTDKVDGVTVGMSIDVTPSNNGLSATTSTTDNQVNGTGLVSNSSVVDQSSSNTNIPAPNNEADILPVVRANFPQGNRVNFQNPANGTESSTSISFPGQFNNSGSALNNPQQPMVVGDVSAPIINEIQNPTRYPILMPNNVSRVLLITNNATVASGVATANSIQAQFPNIQVSLIQSPAKTPSGIGFVLNPTQNGTAPLTRGSTVVIPFITPPIQTAPVIPLTSP